MMHQWGNSGQESGSRNHRRILFAVFGLTRRFAPSYLHGSFLMQLRTTFPGMALFTTDWALLYQPVIKTIPHNLYGPFRSSQFLDGSDSSPQMTLGYLYLQLRDIQEKDLLTDSVMCLVCVWGGTTCATACMYTRQWTALSVVLYLIPCLRKASCSLLHTPGGLACELWGLSCPHSFSNHRSARMTSMSHLIQFVM